MLDNVAVRNRVYGLIELDVTKDREYMRSYKEKTGETLSFTGWIVKCKGQAVSKDKQVQAYRRGKNSARAEPLLLLLPLFSLNVTYRFYRILASARRELRMLPFGWWLNDILLRKTATNDRGKN
jgi:hypothetical protein